jgi:hypothetical protein
MNADDLRRLAALTGAMRHAGHKVPVGALEALLLVGAGVDCATDLVQEMSGHGTPIEKAQVSRFLSLLRGRARYDRGRWVESPMAPLVLVRRHPHRRGQQVLLSEEGGRLLTNHLGYSRTILGVTDHNGEEVQR